MIGKGTQVALDMYRCLEDVVYDKDKIKAILEMAAQKFDMRELAVHLTDNEMDEEFCYVMLCDNGHIFLHVFPAQGYAAADVFTLDSGADPEELAIFLRKEFGPDQAKLTMITRGDFGNVSDMKPRRQKIVKPIRRAKNAGATLKKFMMLNKTSSN